jgi:CRISPR-associated protein Cmr4
MSSIFKQLRYLLVATDPVHVGTGGYRLGRVDNSIVREPGTRLPKIPGSSLHGAIRAYAAKVYENPDAAGQDHTGADPDNCPVCYTFGYIKKATGDLEEADGISGVVSIFDAQILFFPVHSMMGPVWVTTVPLLDAAGFGIDPAAPATGKAKFTFSRASALNLGWMMVNPDGKVTVTPPTAWKDEAQWKSVAGRLVIVASDMFTQIVNSNLEVRTSVSIDPKTGAAKDGALFTFEALPRGVFLTMDAVVDDYRDPNDKGKAFANAMAGLTKNKNALAGKAWKEPEDVMAAGLAALSWLGVGGMGTRGFGRLAQVGKAIELPYNGGAA